MPHPLDDGTQGMLDMIRRTMLEIKRNTHSLGNEYLLAQSVVLMTDLVEHLLRQEHSHGVSVPQEPQRFGGGS
jgi:hypothetical protein